MCQLDPVPTGISKLREFTATRHVSFPPLWEGAGSYHVVCRPRVEEELLGYLMLIRDSKRPRDDIVVIVEHKTLGL